MDEVKCIRIHLKVVGIISEVLQKQGSNNILRAAALLPESFVALITPRHLWVEKYDMKEGESWQQRGRIKQRSCAL